jgi:hypothetical protein
MGYGAMQLWNLSRGLWNGIAEPDPDRGGIDRALVHELTLAEPGGHSPELLELVVIGVDPEPLQISPFALLGGNHKVYGQASGPQRTSRRPLNFAALTGIRPMIEQVPLADAQAALERMLGGKARFRMVLTTGR